MAIPASYIVSVEPRTVTAGSSDLEMNGLLFSRSDLIPASEMVLEFPSARAVGDYFGTTSKEYAAARVYFTGYQNKFTAPRSFFVARRVTDPIPAALRGARTGLELAALKAVTAGTLSLFIDGATVALSGLNFSACQSYSSAAQVLEDALATEKSGTTCTWSSLSGAFTIVSPTTGVTSTISYASSTGAVDLADLMGLTQASGAVASQGSAAMDVAAQMDAVRARTENFVTFSTAWEADAAEMLEWAKWASDNYGWLYVAYTTEAATPVSTSGADPASSLKNAGYDHAAIIYGSLEYAMFIMGSIASIAWLRTNGTITLAFKKQAGIAPTVNSESEAAALDGKNCNYFGNFATRNADFMFLYPGCLSASDYGFIDPYINSVWLNNRIQVALMDGLTRSGRVPYNERGYTMIRSWLMDPVKTALKNAAIEPGVELSEAQKSELINEAGLDISGELQTQGYYIQIEDAGADVRGRRESPNVSLWYTYGGSVQKIEIASTAVL